MVDSNPEMIAAKIAVTRSSLLERIETFEEKVRHSMEEANAAVQETIDNAREVVHDTAATMRKTVASAGEKVTSSIATAREAFDLPHQIRRHPWAAIGAATATGYILARMSEPVACPVAVASASNESARAASISVSSEGTQSASNISAVIAKHLEPMKAFAIGAAMFSVRNMLGNTLDEQWRKPLFEALDDITRELGGRPLTEEAIHGSKDN